MKYISYLLLVACLAAVGGCATAAKPGPPPDAQSAAGIRNNAYSLLDDLLNDEKDVSKVLIVKHNSDELGLFIKTVSSVSGQAADQLKLFGKQDRSLVLDALDLPPGEAATRKAIASTKEKELLTNSHDNFERVLLLTQIEALNYGTHLALVAADNDTDPQRAAWARALSRQMKELYAQGVDLLVRAPHGK